MQLVLALIFVCNVAILNAADLVRHQVSDESHGLRYEHTLVYQPDTDKQPALLMIPNWMGPTPGSLAKAERIARMGYAVMLADVYSTDVRPTTAEEASAAAGALRSGDRAQLRQRTVQALSVLRGLAQAHPIEVSHIGAIGFCFGGCAVLELARDGGHGVSGVVSFHGNLDTQVPLTTVDATSPAILVCHGARDPFVPDQQVQALINEMRLAQADWQLISYGGAVHSFTNPDAAMKGKAEYHERSSNRSMKAMDLFFAELFRP